VECWLLVARMLSVTDAFWEAFHRYAGLDHDTYVLGSFGDNAEMATELSDLVIAGKRAAPDAAQFRELLRLPLSRPTARQTWRRYHRPPASRSARPSTRRRSAPAPFHGGRSNSSLRLALTGAIQG
jgi:hypothetical protein